MDRVRSATGLQRYIMTNLRLTGRTVGSGRPGRAGVELTTEGGLISVGKEPHVATVADLVQECALLFDLRHPNVIQCLGLCVSDSGSTLIVMEYLPDSLDLLLQKMTHFSLAMKYSILCDVCRGLEYLHCHTSPITHGKLTASNVLLTSAMTAKISDVRAFIRSSDNGSMTPRELAYLPPEVQDANPCSSVAVDVFSFGQLSLYTLLQEFPTPTASTYININNPEAMNTRTEIQRRASHLQQLSDQLDDTSHPAVKLINQCLQNDPDQRPSIQQVASYLKEWTVPSDNYQQMTKLELVGKIRKMEVKMKTAESGCHVQSVIAEFQQKTLEVEQLQVQLKDCETKLQQKTMEVQQLQSMMENAMTSDQAEEATVNHSNQTDAVPEKEEETIIANDQAGASEMCEQVGPCSDLCQAELPLPSVLTFPAISEVSAEKIKSISPTGTVKQKPVFHVQPIQLLESGEFKPFACSYCEAKFARYAYLKQHTRIHTGEKPYACSKCPAKFAQATALKTHMRTHTGEKPFTCKLCPAKFLIAAGLKTHMRSHSGSKPFSCLHCDMTFKASSKLRSHISSVHPEVKGLFCIYCDAKFSNPATLKQHYRTHTGDKPFYCIHCKARFAESLVLREHQRTHVEGNQNS